MKNWLINLFKKETPTVVLPYNEDYEAMPFLDIEQLPCRFCGFKAMTICTMGAASLVGKDIEDGEIGMRIRIRSDCSHCHQGSEWRLGIKTNRKLTKTTPRDEGWGFDFHFERNNK